MRTWRIFVGILLAVITASTGGCANKSGTIPVSGKVTLDGKELETGAVTFSPITSGEPAIGQIQADGTFHLRTKVDGDGALAGRYRVSVAAFKKTSASPTSPGMPTSTLGESIIPVRYNNSSTSGIQLEVTTSGANNFPIELLSNAKK